MFNAKKLVDINKIIFQWHSYNMNVFVWILWKQINSGAFCKNLLPWKQARQTYVTCNPGREACIFINLPKIQQLADEFNNK